MKLILLTRPDFFSGEADTINALFAAGLPIIHLRKPQATEEQKEALVAQIAPTYRDRIVMHNHDLHSCHTLDEVRTKKEQILMADGQWSMPDGQCSYLFLSPIFDSISKRGYRAAFTDDELLQAHRDGIIDDKVIALGGITPSNASKAIALGFGGVAVLGDIWMSDSPLLRLQEYMCI